MEELLKCRADLLAQLELVEAAIQSASAPLRAYRVRTHRNIRNTATPPGVQFYADKLLTRRADISGHEAYVSGAALAALQAGGFMSSSGGDIQLLD
ncbi:MAG: hypothetical protein KAX65_07400 [Caldilineaceae bacterium]|nr:hypothetical protein [Caldilineaceae bacterium]